MSRVKIELPELFSFTCRIPVRITDINYGGHVGNDAVLSLIHEARMQFLAYHGYAELNFAGAAMIMASVCIEFKNELFYGDQVLVSVAAGNFSKASFDLYYRLEKENSEKKQLIATAQTSMVCYDYAKKKIVSLPASASQKLSS